MIQTQPHQFFNLISQESHMTITWDHMTFWLIATEWHHPITHLVSHGGREEHRLSLNRTQLDNFIHLIFKMLIQHPCSQQDTHTPEHAERNTLQVHLGKCQEKIIKLCLTNIDFISVFNTVTSTQCVSIELLSTQSTQCVSP